MAKIKIYRAGLTGLIAATILRKDHDVTLYSETNILQNNHHALLRFKDDAIEKATGIKCKKVIIKKAVYYKKRLYNESNIKFDNMG